MSAPSPSYLLTKSRFMMGRTCIKRAWLQLHRPDLARNAKPPPMQQHQLQVGLEVGRLARDLFPDGHLVMKEHTRDADSTATTRSFTNYKQELQHALERTKELMAATNSAAPSTASTHDDMTLFEATFEANQTLVQVDILTRDHSVRDRTADDAWHLIEVKASKNIAKRKDFVTDVALQVHTLRQAGVNVTKASICHLNSEYRCPETTSAIWDADRRNGEERQRAREALTRMFHVTDITDAVEGMLHEQDLPEEILTQLSVFRSTSEDDARLDAPFKRHCVRPDPCVYAEYCWGDMFRKESADIEDAVENEIAGSSPNKDAADGRCGNNKGSSESALTTPPLIYDIRKLHKSKEAKLLRQQIFLLEDVPPDFPLSQNQQQQVQLVQNKQVHIDYDAIRTEMDRLAYPLYFLDFETINQAIPWVVGTGPYDHVPFQFSLHKLTEGDDGVGDDGVDDPSRIKLVHSEYLHTDKSTDPHETLAQALLQQFDEDDAKNNGSIIVYHAAFERRMLQQLAERLPHHSERLNNLIDRLWDLEPIFSKHYRHHAFLGRSSIKKVLPTLVPHYSMAYDNLDVQDGMQAQMAWLEIVGGSEGTEEVTEREQGEHLRTLQQMAEINTKIVYIDRRNSESSVAEKIDLESADTETVERNDIDKPLPPPPQQQQQQRRRNKIRSLLSYCELDTIAMVHLYLHVRDVMDNHRTTCVK